MSLNSGGPNSPPNVLLVDDNPANLMSLRVLLEGLQANLVDANSGEAALELVQEQDFAVILLDVYMPGISGFRTAELFRSHDRARHSPIIFLTAANLDQQELEAGYRL